MLKEEVNQLLEPGHLSIETGYFRLSNGDMHVRVLGMVPGGKGIMLDWWIGNITNNELFRMWHPKEHDTLVRDNNWPKGPWKPGFHEGASHVAVQTVGGVTIEIRMRFVTPSEFGFDMARFKDAGVTACICGNSYDMDDNPVGSVVHLARDTEYGCEVRSLFWLPKVPEEAAKGLLEHALVENGLFAVMVPGLYAKAMGNK